MKAALKLRGLSLRFDNQKDGWSNNMPYRPHQGHLGNPGPEHPVVAKLSLKFTTPGGLLGELVALVSPELNSMSWSGTTIWLKHFTAPVGQAVDSYYQASTG